MSASFEGGRSAQLKPHQPPHPNGYRLASARRGSKAVTADALNRSLVETVADPNRSARADDNALLIDHNLEGDISLHSCGERGRCIDRCVAALEFCWSFNGRFCDWAVGIGHHVCSNSAFGA